MRAPLLSACIVAAALAFPAAARAGNNAAAAQALFEEARSLIAAGNYAAGCAKLEGSQALDPGAGTQYNLALCYEKSGRTASAWATYLEAAAASKATSRPDWEAKARDRATALADTLSKVRIVTPPGAPSDLAITRDGVAVVASELGAAIPVDPGPHVVEARASGRTTFRVSTVVAAGQSKQIDVVLEGAATPPPETGARSPDHTLAYVVGGLGVAGVAFGAVAGLVAVNKNASSTDACPNDGVCRDAAARSDNRAAGDWATASTVGFIAGGALLAAGVVLFFAAPGSKTAAGTRHRTTVGIGPAGVVGTW
ncbi:hypothetical protein BH11MYX4_BH11MYX4_44350 [soil metagenome]